MFLTHLFLTLVALLTLLTSTHADDAIPGNVTAIADHGSPNCNPAGQNWGAAVTYDVRSGIIYLNNHGGNCDSPENSSASGCTRVSCSYDAAIFVCNDNNYHIYPTCAYVASLTKEIVDSCAHLQGVTNVVKGQLFDFGDVNGNGGFNVVVRSDGC